ncbi:hypothetical protein GA0061101_101601 [Rhizobium lusitanum]|uniref:NADH:flavin oxidoreductase/NADH oxidase N-terminal domain-containing protein n=1 Tax=Rhizobium lusitanum TaxID=293958 RepID=A0A1C3U6N2_9HYPH|nr:hypothetical protein GA0061101_101601 [Rhizobium lusitanum]
MEQRYAQSRCLITGCNQYGLCGISNNGCRVCLRSLSLHVALLGATVDYHELLRPRLAGSYIIGGGLTQARAEELLREGKADAVVFGTAFLANPDCRSVSPQRASKRTGSLDLLCARSQGLYRLSDACRAGPSVASSLHAACGSAVRAFPGKVRSGFSSGMRKETKRSRTCLRASWPGCRSAYNYRRSFPCSSGSSSALPGRCRTWR